MGLNMNVYGVKHERLWGNVRCDHATPTFPDFNMNVYGGNQIKMCVYGEGFGIRLSDSCFRCGN